MHFHPYMQREEVKLLIKDIRESHSSYASFIVLEHKKNSAVRMCYDFRALNKLPGKERYPLRPIQDQINNLKGNTFFTTLDMASGFH